MPVQEGANTDSESGDKKGLCGIAEKFMKTLKTGKWTVLRDWVTQDQIHEFPLVWIQMQWIQQLQLQRSKLRKESTNEENHDPRPGNDAIISHLTNYLTTADQLTGRGMLRSQTQETTGSITAILLHAGASRFSHLTSDWNGTNQFPDILQWDLWMSHTTKTMHKHNSVMGDSVHYIGSVFCNLRTFVLPLFALWEYLHLQGS